MAQSRDLIVRILADTSKLTAGMGEANGKLNGLSRGLKAAGTAFAAFAAADVAVDFLNSATHAAEEDKKSQALLANQLKATNSATKEQIESVEQHISVLSRQTGVMDDDLRPAYAALARATGDTEQANSELAIAMDIAAGRGVDLETVTAALEKAHNGNIGALGRLGVATKDAEGNTLSLEAAMAGAAKTYEGAAEAAVTPGQRMKVAWSELQEQIGTVLLPVLENLSTFMADTLLPAFQDAIVWIQTNWPEIERVIGEVFEKIKPWLDMFVDNITTAFNVVKDIFKLFNDLLHGDFSKAWEDFRDLVSDIWDGIKSTIGDAIGIVKSQIETLWQVGGDVVIGAVNGVIGFFETTINKGIDLINVALDVLDKAAGPFVNFGDVGHVSFGRFGEGGGGNSHATSVTKLAAGGIVTRPTLAMIGESGPEAVVPLGRGGGMGSSFNIGTLTVQANNPEQLVAALQDYARRNGGLRLSGGVATVS